MTEFLILITELSVHVYVCFCMCTIHFQWGAPVNGEPDVWASYLFVLGNNVRNALICPSRNTVSVPCSSLCNNTRAQKNRPDNKMRHEEKEMKRTIEFGFKHLLQSLCFKNNIMVSSHQKQSEFHKFGKRIIREWRNIHRYSCLRIDFVAPREELASRLVCAL